MVMVMNIGGDALHCTTVHRVHIVERIEAARRRIGSHQLAQSPGRPRLLRQKTAVIAARRQTGSRCCCSACGRSAFDQILLLAGTGAQNETAIIGALDASNDGAVYALGGAAGCRVMIVVGAAFGDAVDGMTIGATVGRPDPT